MEPLRPGGPILALHVEALGAYTRFAAAEAARVERNLKGLSPDDLADLVRSPDMQVAQIREASDLNVRLLDRVVTRARSHTGTPPPAAAEARAAASEPGSQSSTPEAGGAAGPVKRSLALLAHFAREWATEGVEERDGSIGRIMAGLETHADRLRETAQTRGLAKPRVLCPASKLGRLPFELQRAGFEVEACEGNPLMFFGAELVRHECRSKEETVIRPYCLNTCNRLKAEDNVRNTPIPDVELGEGDVPEAVFGDLVQLYGTAAARGSFDALATSFALNSSANIFRFVRTAAHVVRAGGVWVNFGPLEYDAEHDEGHAASGIDLSWEELKYALSHFFTVEEESFHEAFYAGNKLSMMAMQFSCVSFVAVRNEVPAAGIGEGG